MAVTLPLLLALLQPVQDATPRAPDQDLAQDLTQDLSLEVQKAFLVHCGSCHGSHLEKPEGDFGFLDDLRRIATDEDFVVAGDPADSILFDSISLDPDDPDFMPPIDADEAPMSAAQVEMVRRWIETGAEVSDAAQALMGSLGEASGGGETTATAASSAVEPADAAGAADARAPPDLARRWRRFIGQFHTASTHLPIGLILAAVLAEFLSLFGHRDRLRYVARFCLLFGTLGAAFSVASGWWKAEGTYGYRGLFEAPGMLFETTESGRPLRGNELWWHRWLGVFSAAGGVVAFSLAMLAGRANAGRGLLLGYRLWLLVLAAVIGLVGFLGGKLVHGAEGAYQWL